MRYVPVLLAFSLRGLALALKGNQQRPCRLSDPFHVECTLRVGHRHLIRRFRLVRRVQ